MNPYVQLIKERGIFWFVNRSLYSCKLKVMSMLPITERFFEKKIGTVKNINLFNIDTLHIKSILNDLNDDEKSELISMADDACVGVIKGFSSITLDYGLPINWQLNPLTGKSTDISKKWYKISDFDKERGDIKVIWEISRFSHFFLLARAYLLTDNLKYYKAFSEQLVDWLYNNPYSYGANFKCGQECAIRMLSTLMVSAIFLPIMSEKDIENVKELISRCYRKILSNFSYAYKCQNNNHTLSELAGMIAGAWCIGDKNKIQWAYNKLDEVISKQFLCDGGYIQQSFNYQRVALQDVEAVLAMSKVTGYSLSAKSKELILKSALQMYQCQDISGDMPNYGSNDGALIFPVTSCSYRDFTPCINTVYALLNAKTVYTSGRHDEELVWFGIRDILLSEEIKRVTSRFDKTGLYTYRTDDYWVMLVAKTELSHMDQNHLDVWVNEKNIFCDSGTYSYADDLGRHLFSSGAHNTVFCNGKEQIYRIGAFAVYGQPKLNKVICNDNSIETEIEYYSGYTHRRLIEFSEGEVTVTDSVKCESDAEADFRVLFHTPCDVNTNNGNEILLDEYCKMLVQIPIEVSKAKRSLFYMKYDEINCIGVSLEKGKSFMKIKILKNKGENKR